MMQTKELEAYLEMANYNGQYSNETHNCSCSGNLNAAVRTVAPVRSNVASANNVANPIIPRGATAENTVTPSRSNVTTAVVPNGSRITTNPTTSGSRLTTAPTTTTSDSRTRSLVTTPVVSNGSRITNTPNTTLTPRSSLTPNPTVVVPPSGTVTTPPVTTPPTTTTRSQTTTGPVIPVIPVIPVVPVAPTNPANPSTPTTPVTPTNPAAPTDPYAPPTYSTDVPGAATGADNWDLGSGSTGNSGMPIETDPVNNPVDEFGNPLPVVPTQAKAGNWLLAALAVGAIYMMAKKKKTTVPRTVKI